LTTTPAYNPKSNLVERAHRDLKSVLRAMMIETGKDWEELLPSALFAIRTSRNISIGLSPFEALFGHHPSIPIECLCPPPDTALHSRRHIIAQCQNFVRQNMEQTILRQKRRYSSTRLHFQPGEKVWLYSPIIDPKRGKKFSLFWTGPWTIQKRINPVLYKIVHSNPGRSPPKTLHVSIDRIKPYKDNTEGRQHHPTEEHSLEDFSPGTSEQIPILQMPEASHPPRYDEEDLDDFSLGPDLPSSNSQEASTYTSPNSPSPSLRHSTSQDIISPPRHSPIPTPDSVPDPDPPLPSPSEVPRRSSRLAEKPRHYYSPSQFATKPDARDSLYVPRGPLARQFPDDSNLRHHPYRPVSVRYDPGNQLIRQLTRPTLPVNSHDSTPPTVSQPNV